jgi:hypothetical protein
MVQSPRGAMFDTALLPLTAPMSSVRRKRVTLLYRPRDDADAVRFSLLVTVTATTDHELRQTCEAVRRAAWQARVRLRPVHGAQAAAFAIALGVGVVPADHSRVPPGLREMI